MKITYVTMQFPVPSETFASWDIESLRKNGHDVTIYGMRFRHASFRYLITARSHDGLKINHFSFLSFLNFISLFIRYPLIITSLLCWIFSNCFRSPKHLLKSLLLFPSAISIFSCILRDKPNVVHLFWGHYPSMVGYLVKKFMPNTVVSMFLGAHDLVVEYPCSLEFSKDVDLIFTHSKSNLSFISKLGISADVNVVMRGIRINFEIESAVNKFEQLDNPIFLTAGRLIREKGFDDVLMIFQGVLRYNPHAILYIAGDGPYRKNLDKLVDNLSLKSNVFFLGHVDQNSLIKIMAKSHFFLLMSRYPSERLPNVVKEAMYQKCIIVTTNSNGIDELIDNGVDGFIVEKGDWSNGLICVLKCLSNRSIIYPISMNANCKIMQKFDVNISMKKYINLWQNAVESQAML